MMDAQERSSRVYDILRALRLPEPTSGVRVGILTYNETVAFDALLALMDEAAKREALGRTR